MSLTEYDEEEYLRDSFQEGVEVGQTEKAIDDATELLKEKIEPQIIAKCVKLPLEQVLELKKSITVLA